MKSNVFLFLLLMFSLTIAASDFKVNGLNFKILSYQEMTVAVEPVELSTTPYSGDIVVPEQVVYGGRTWTVVELSERAFGYCENITSVKLPSTLKKIGKNGMGNREMPVRTMQHRH